MIKRIGAGHDDRFPPKIDGLEVVTGVNDNPVSRLGGVDGLLDGAVLPGNVVVSSESCNTG